MASVLLILQAADLIGLYHFLHINSKGKNDFA